MIQAKPMTEEQCTAVNLTPEGTYPFKVESCQEVCPELGDPYFKLRLTVLVGEGQVRTQFDALFFGDRMMWKTRHFYKSIGKLALYETGRYVDSHVTLSEGLCCIKHRPRKDNGELESYVKDYVETHEHRIETTDSENDVPF
jgi:hypothetical protein